MLEMCIVSFIVIIEGNNAKKICKHAHKSLQPPPPPPPSSLLNPGVFLGGGGGGGVFLPISDFFLTMGEGGLADF